MSVAHQGVEVVVLDEVLIRQIGEQAFVDVLLPSRLVDGILVPVGLRPGERSGRETISTFAAEIRFQREGTS